MRVDKAIRDELAAGVMAVLAQHGIPTDVQELLVYGDPERDIAPGALSAACAVIWNSKFPSP